LPQHCFCSPQISAFGREARLVRYPHYHNGRIVFTYLGDLWTADENGQNVQRLTVNERATFTGDSLPTESGLLSRVSATAISTST
jgi:hypothetical protein